MSSIQGFKIKGYPCLKIVVDGGNIYSRFAADLPGWLSAGNVFGEYLACGSRIRCLVFVLPSFIFATYRVKHMFHTIILNYSFTVSRNFFHMIPCE